MKSRVLVANWKMNKTAAEAVRYGRQLREVASRYPGIEIILAPSFTLLHPLQEVLRGSPVSLAGQNIHWEEKGAYTGEVSADQVRDAGCRYVLIGHSERRQYFGERYDQVNRKVQAAWRRQLYPIVCLGETETERDAGRTYDVLEEQVCKGLGGIPADLVDHLLIAYEPVWAIGTGRPVTSQQASESHRVIRKKLGSLLGSTPDSSVRILYGGSVTTENAASLLSEPEVDGLLVGGASLEFEEFSEIVGAAARVSAP